MTKNFRDAILNAELPAEIVSVDIGGTEYKVEVRQRTVKQQYDLIDKTTKPDGSLNGMLLAVETLIACCHDPETGDPFFEPADRDALLNADFGYFQDLLSAANRAAGVESDEAVTARLEETPADATSIG